MTGQQRAPAASMANKTVVLTGGTSGIGAEAADELARRGARLILVARDAARAEATLARLRRSNPKVEHTHYLADLSSMAETRAVAATISAAEPRLDVLVNNAGAMFGKRQVTGEGLERTFATNHMGPFVMTLGLKDSLAAAGGARVVTTSSSAHRMARFDADDPQMLRNYMSWRAYGASKLDNILFTRELARRWAVLGVTANCFHPGVVSTRFGDGTGDWLSPVIRIVKLFAITPEKGARTLIYLASAPEVAGVSGRYFESCKEVQPAGPAQDEAAAAALWAESARLAGVSG